ncbi:Signal transduction histidine kinase [Glycomyces sambucus]|uniref:histidine kinase n=1 Tax=Glycomyces sambucus TaxID=380244 RepID=A0A1G9HVQ5_9ACTN|nr:HAMP domain-containing sensor histidine kinase [Glycomyces sambucus]SDL17050.1 Signal transduction histidine kinase [Glycomyces sambucus]
MRLRTRLTLWYGGAFFAAGAVLTAVVYLVVRSRITANMPEPGESLEALFTSGSQFGMTDAQIAYLIDTVIERQQAANDATLQAVLLGSGIALGVVGLLAVVFGFLMAGRVLRPIDAITATAQRVADRSLHERINLDGPGDELKRLADTFDGMLARLDRAFEGQRRFVANASHELKTPLAINRTLLEVAAAEPDAGHRVRDLAANLLAVNERHERLIDGLLTLAGADRDPADPVPVDLADIVAHLAAQFAPEAAEAQVSVDVSCEEAVAVGDAALLERLVANLIANGIRHNHPGGALTVRTAAVDGRARLTVTNTGPAVAAYEVDALFQPFRRGEGRDRIESVRGVGLGLSIVESVARVHDAALTAVPNPDGGLRVTVAFSSGHAS